MTFSPVLFFYAVHFLISFEIDYPYKMQIVEYILNIIPSWI